MMPFIRGRLIGSAFAADVLPTLPLFSAPTDAVRIAMERCAERSDATLGPASSVRAIADVAVIPLLAVLGWTCAARDDGPEGVAIRTTGGGSPGPTVLTTSWGASLDRTWRTTIHQAIGHDARWCLGCNGIELRIIDAQRTWSRDHLAFDLASTLREPAGQAVLWSLARAEAMAGTSPFLDQAVALSARHGSDVCQALGHGVLDALSLLVSASVGRRTLPRDLLFDQSLTVLYRVLFLLFAEARGLVPVWHPAYRDRYSLEAIVSALLDGRRYTGLWHAVQAISRLAHSGCAAGELKVTAFNGRLFAPSQSALFDRRPIADGIMRDAVVAVSSIPQSGGGGRTRISYRDLDVEQLGAVYERVLDYEPAAAGAPALVRTREQRKATGAFYTPRGLTASLVSRTLLPLVRGRSASEILALRILDPAMGSGAFLVAACRFLARATEEALLTEGRWHAGDVTPADRALLRREIASRCLYGVDVNPMAVQLARLSLWLTTLAADKPLSFLDHHLVTGDSLIGARPADLQRQPPGPAGRRRRSLPLFDDDALADSLADAARTRTRLATDPDDTVDVVRRKEQALATLTSAPTAVNIWGRMLDLWCAAWFWPDGSRPDAATCGELIQQIRHGRSALPVRTADKFLAQASVVAGRIRCLHWPLVFPEVFTAGGFDAVIANPPWDMVRGDIGAAEARGERRRQARDANGFFRESGVYVVDGRAHANRYQLFVERSLQLLRAGGRLGLVLPSGILTDAGSAPLRRHLFERASVDAITGVDNRGGIFPIHRSVRFVLLDATAGAPTERIRCRFGVTRLVDLEDPQGPVLELARGLLTRISGADDLGIPELASPRDLGILERISARVPRLADADGWNVTFGRELNATDDRGAFVSRSADPRARPVVEGKHLSPFHVAADASALRLNPAAAVGRRVPRRARLAYRDVASATNRLTLIAALVPGHVVTTHTLFCLKQPLPLARQQVLCALLNSYVANYLIRLRVTTHVTAMLMSRLRVPVVTPAHQAFSRLQRIADALATAPRVESASEYAELQALAAHLYGVSAADFAHILETFPLIPESTRRAALDRFIHSRPPT